MLTMMPKACPSAGPSAPPTKFSHVAQHVIAHALGARRVHVAVDDLQTAERVHGQTEQRGENADLDHHPQNCGRGSFNHRWLRVYAAGVEPHHAGGVRDCLDTGKRKHDSDKAGPVLPKRSAQWLQMTDRFTHVWETEKSERDDDDRRWH